jgi:TonB-dependent receptor
MNLSPSRVFCRRLCLRLVFAVGASALAASALSAATLSGTVNNSATGNLLEGARVEIPALKRTVLADQTGRYVFPNIPAGSYEVVANYLGLDESRATVNLAGDQRATLDFNLTSGVYTMQQFEVTGEREGSAAAITAQRNAENVKNVVAMDQFGNLPNMSAGELAMRLPGVAGNLDDEGNVSGLTVRGFGPTLNRVTIDGSLMAGNGGLNRQFQTHALTGGIFEELEVIKGHTPDQSADSLGGTINLKTRSPLSMAEKRRFSYSAGLRLAPTFSQQIPLRSDHPAHPLLNFSYQEVFDVLGGSRNLGVAISTFYSENVAGYFRTIRDYENTTRTPAYVWDYRTQDAFNNRKQEAFNLKADYRLSPQSKFSFGVIVSDANEPFNRLYETRAYTNQTTPNATTSGVIPGYTDRITSVRPVAASVIDVTETMYSFYGRTRQLNFEGEHKFDRLSLDYTVNGSSQHSHLGVGGGGTLKNRITGIGWTLDRTKSDLYPSFVQTAGPDITDPSNYRPNGPITARNSKRNTETLDYRANARYTLPTEIPLSVKAGADYRIQKVFENGGGQRWNYVGTTALPSDPSIVTWSSLKTGLKIPQWEGAQFIKDYHPVDPALWSEDNYYREQLKYTGTRGVTEFVTSGYGMMQGKWRGLGFVGGVRVEKTKDDAWGFTKAKVGSTSTQQKADPVGSAAADYAGNYRERIGNYTKAFPSAHLTYDLTSNVKAHLSWSQSFGRPAFTNLLPTESYNDTAQTLTINNQSLKPQLATNWDATLEYYFEPVGQLSAGWFHKTIKDFLVNGILSGTVPTGPDNGYNGEFGGYTILTAANAGTAFVQGWELTYQQQFTSLPGLLRGLSLSANYTSIDTHGDFGGSSYRTGGQVVGFIPRTANLSLSWRYRKFSTRLLWNYQSDYIRSYSASTPGRNQYYLARTVINLGVNYDLRRGVGLFADVSNLTNEPQSYYRGIPDQMERTIYTGTTITVGVQGKF